MLIKKIITIVFCIIFISLGFIIKHNDFDNIQNTNEAENPDFNVHFGYHTITSGMLPPFPYNPDDANERTRRVTRIQPINGTVDVPAPLPANGIRGQRNILVAMVEFQDRQFEPQYSKEYFENLLFHPTENSLKTYYMENSYGNLFFNGTVIDGIIFNESISDYKYYPGFINDNIMEIIERSFEQAGEKVDISQFDMYNHAGEPVPDGIIDHFMVIFPTDNQLWQMDKDIWPHRGGINPQTVQVNGKKLSTYTIIGHIFPLGTFVHEMGHDIGLPDFYDIDYSSHGGVGYWSPMAEGSFLGPNRGDYPCHMSPYAKIQLGWVNPRIITSTAQNISLRNIEDYADIVKVPIGSFRSPEYFLIENRMKAGFDFSIKDEGIVIWHIDERKPGNSSDRNRLLDVEESTSRQDLDLSPHVQIMSRDYLDAFNRSGNAVFNRESNPNSKTYQGADSQVDIKIISDAAQEMTINVNVPEIETIAGVPVSVANEDFSTGEFMYLDMYNQAEQLVKLASPATGLTISEVDTFMINYSAQITQTKVTLRIYQDNNGEPGDVLYSQGFIDVNLNVNPPYQMVKIQIEDGNLVYIPGESRFWIGIEYKAYQRDAQISVCSVSSEGNSQTSFVRLSVETSRMQNFSDMHFIMRAAGYEGQQQSSPSILNSAIPEDPLVQMLREAEYLTDVQNFTQAADVFYEIISQMNQRRDYYAFYLPVVYNSFGYNGFKSQNYDVALRYFRQTLRLIENSGDDYAIAAVCANIGETSYYVEEYDQAYEYYFRSMEINEELDRVDDRRKQLLEDYFWLAKICMALEQNDEALEYVQIAFPLAQELALDPDVIADRREELILEMWDQLESD